MKKLLILAALFFALPAWGQPTLVAHGITQSTGALGVTVPASGSLNMTSANFIHICGIGDYTGTSTAPTDSSSNLYTLVASEKEDDDTTTYAWVSFAPTVTSTMTFTVGGNVTLAEVSGWSGIASGPDAQSKSQDGNTNSLTSGNLVPTNANELLLSCFGTYSQQTNTVNSPMTLLDVAEATGTHPAGNWIDGAGLAYQIQTTKTTVNPTWPSGSYFAGAVVSASYFSTETPATLTITSTGVPEGFLSTAYSATNSLYSNILTASGGVQPYTWSCPATCALPAGLSLNSSTGAITGTPTSAGGPTNVTFKVTDAQSTTATVTLPMTVASAVLSTGAGTCTGSVLSMTQYTTFAGCTLLGSGGTAPITFSYSTAPGTFTPPEGLSLNSSTGAISGTIYGTGTYVPTFTIQDALGSYKTFSSVSFAVAGNYTWSENIFFPSNSIFHSRVDGLPLCTAEWCIVNVNDLGDSPTVLADLPSGGIPYAHWPYNQADLTVTTNWPGYGAQAMFSPFSPTSPGYSTSTYTPVQSAPISPYATIEGTQNNSNATTYINDGHSLSVTLANGSTHAYLYEMYNSQYSGGQWYNASDAMWDLSSNAMPCQDCGTTDAAGLPIAPLLYTYDETLAGAINHPGRFTVGNNRILKNYVWPATAYAQGDACSTNAGGYTDGNGMLMQTNPAPCSNAGAVGRIPYGQLYRLKSSVSAPAACAGNTLALNMLTAWKNYGMMMADGGANGKWYVIAADDARWGSQLNCINTGADKIVGSDFEVPETAQLIANLPANCPGTAGACTTLNSYQAIQPTAGAQTSGAVTFSGGVVLQ